MDLHDRIARRQTARHGQGIVVDREQLSPAVHRDEPVGRGAVLEAFLDALDPVFDGALPPDVAVVGPPGSGTSAVTTALFDALHDHYGTTHDAIGTTTRASIDEPVTWFVTIDGRRVDSGFAFYRALLSALSNDPVPASGVGTDVLCERVREHLDRPGRRAVIAIDHHDEPEALSYDAVRDLLSPVLETVSLVAVGQREPDAWTGPSISFPPYHRHELVDIVTERASAGLAAGAIDHELIRELCAWADGNAHDALAALFCAAVLADEDGNDRIESSHFETAVDDLPTDGVHVDRALALSETRTRALCALLTADCSDRPIREVAAEVATRSSLSAGTVKRFLYELAERGVVERVPLPANGSGRRPSTIEPRFPRLVFLTLSCNAVLHQ